MKKFTVHSTYRDEAIFQVNITPESFRIIRDSQNSTIFKQIEAMARDNGFKKITAHDIENLFYKSFRGFKNIVDGEEKLNITITAKAGDNTVGMRFTFIKVVEDVFIDEEED
jgi:hypothetical protein